MKRFLVLTVVCVFCLMLPPGSQPASATFFGESGTIAFDQHTLTDDGIVNWEIFTLDGGSSEPENLSNAAFYQGHPAYSPDGRMLAFASNSGLLVLHLKSGELRLVVRNRLKDGRWRVVWEPAWSPDGTKLVYAWVRYGPDVPRPTTVLDSSVQSSAIKIVDRSGENANAIVSATSGVNMEPDWSPDGKTIVFSRFSPGYENAGMSDLYTIDPDGGNLRRIPEERWADAPSWTPDGRILFRSERGCPRELYVCATLYSIERDGSDAEQLIQWPDDWTGDAEPDMLQAAAMSPDSSKILVHLQPFHHTFVEENPEQLWLWDLATGARRLLVENEMEIGEIDFRPHCTHQGTGDDDLLVGTPARDLICGLGGDDTIRGFGGDDVIFGHRGDDRIVGGEGRDIVVGNAGLDRCDRDPRDFSRIC